MPESALRRLYSCANVVHNPHEDGPLAGSQREAMLQNAQFIITGWGADGLDERDYAAAPNLKMVGLIGSSIKKLCPEIAWERGIAITNTARAVGESVAEFTVGAILNWVHRYNDYDARLKSGSDWNATKHHFLQQDLADLTVGLIGYGAVGSHVSRLITNFGARVVVYDPFVAPEHLAEQRLERAGDLMDMMRNCDVISLHAGLTDETHQMIGAAELAAMKPGALLVNTSRGALIDESALLAALQTQPIYAALDVMVEEPLPPTHPLRLLTNVALTPHIAGFSNRSVYRRCANTVVDDILRFLDHQTPANLVTPKMYSLMT